ncbi:hypothetical protein SADUNF_Sadunf17G0121300 [Salix dunnii]|uniref:Uncharacterized protein n=1 Tax=Salix dunnii TaxID=1413687 RepID=A0A835MF33_9ROSI|nr:hypothetical protein SADUNF_Sadunf17G0121300 [Salix dunnii]
MNYISKDSLRCHLSSITAGERKTEGNLWGGKRKGGNEDRLERWSGFNSRSGWILRWRLGLGRVDHYPHSTRNPFFSFSNHKAGRQAGNATTSLATSNTKGEELKDIHPTDADPSMTP